MLNTFGSYNLVLISAKTMVMTCATAVPEATTATLRTNLLLQVWFINPFTIGLLLIAEEVQSQREINCAKSGSGWHHRP